MNTEPAPSLMSASFSALLRTRLRVLKRRYGNRLNMVLAGLALLALYWQGQSWAPRLATVSLESLAIFAVASFGAWTLLTAAGLRSSLGESEENRLLLAQPVSLRQLLLLRVLEQLAAQLLLLLALGAVGLGLGFAGASSLDFGWASLMPGLMLGSLGLGIGLAILGLRLPGLIGGLALIGAALLALLQKSLASLLISIFMTSVETKSVALGPALTLLGAGGISCALAWTFAASRIEELHSRAISQQQRPSLFIARVLRVILWPLPKAERGLIYRDLLMLARGSYSRGAVVIFGLWLVPLAFSSAARDPKLELWAFELATLLCGVFIAAALAFLTGADFAQSRSEQALLERALPIRGAAVHRARMILALALSIPYALALMGIVAGRPGDANLLLRTSGELFLLLIMLADLGAAVSLRAELDRSGAEGLAFPLIVGAAGVGLSAALMIHPALALAWPWLRGRTAFLAAVLYENSELRGGAGG